MFFPKNIFCKVLFLYGIFSCNYFSLENFFTGPLKFMPFRMYLKNAWKKINPQWKTSLERDPTRKLIPNKKSSQQVKLFNMRLMMSREAMFSSKKAMTLVEICCHERLSLSFLLPWFVFPKAIKEKNPHSASIMNENKVFAIHTLSCCVFSLKILK